MIKVGVVGFTSKGNKLIDQLIEPSWNLIRWNKEQVSLAQWFVEYFYKVDAIIVVGSLGITVRMIGKLLKSKTSDPAVIVIDEKGEFVIPVLSSHLGGGMRLALSLAKKLKATPVITTATDVHQVFAVDLWSKEQNCEIINPEKIKIISSALLEGDEVGFYSDFKGTDNLPTGVIATEARERGICLSLNPHKKPFRETLNLIPKILTLGVGCRKGIESAEFEDFVLRTCSELKISIKAIQSMRSVSCKANEKCLLDFSEKYNIDFQTYSVEELRTVSGEFRESSFVNSVIGIGNVCERSALYKVQGSLFCQKRSEKGMTLAIGIGDWRYSFDFANGGD